MGQFSRTANNRVDQRQNRPRRYLEILVIAQGQRFLNRLFALSGELRHRDTGEFRNPQFADKRRTRGESTILESNQIFNADAAFGEDPMFGSLALRRSEHNI